MKKIVVIPFIILFLIMGEARAQSAPSDNLNHSQPDSLKLTNKPASGKAFATLSLGGGFSELGSESAGLLSPFDENGLKTLRATVSIRMINRRFYQMHLEVGYTGRGALQTFTDDNVFVKSDVRLHYVQATWMPLVVKSGIGAFGAFAGAGGYGAYKVAESARYTVNDKAINAPASSPEFVNSDYGLSLGGGFYFKKHLVEIRFEKGLKPIFVYPDGRSLYNRSMSLILHL